MIFPSWVSIYKSTERAYQYVFALRIYTSRFTDTQKQHNRTFKKWAFPLLGCDLPLDALLFQEMATILSEKDVKLDSKHRVTVRKPLAEHYRMKQYDDGTVLLEPMQLVSKKTLEEMEIAVSKVKQGIEGNPVDMHQVTAILKDSDV